MSRRGEEGRGGRKGGGIIQNKMRLGREKKEKIGGLRGDKGRGGREVGGKVRGRKGKVM